VKLDLRIVELLCLRLCHDLISPVSAANNGIELLTEFGESLETDAIDLIAESAKTASRRLEFFRAAYGLPGGAADLPLELARRLAMDSAEGSGSTLTWTGAASVDGGAPGGLARLVLNLVLLAGEALPRGGRIDVMLAPPPASPLTVTAVGEGATLSDETLAALALVPDIDEITARSVHAYFTMRLANAWGMTLAVDAGSPGRMAFTVSRVA
jgi:histidine phosphotransferase ChpT